MGLRFFANTYHDNDEASHVFEQKVSWHRHYNSTKIVEIFWTPDQDFEDKESARLIRLIDMNKGKGFLIFIVHWFWT